MPNTVPCGVSNAERLYQERLELGSAREAFYSDRRDNFVLSRTHDLMQDHASVLAALCDLIDSDSDRLVAITLRDAIMESGHNWDGVSAFGDLIRAKLHIRALQEWEEKPRFFQEDMDADRADFFED